MSQERRLLAWLTQLDKPSMVDVRFRDEVVDSIPLSENTADDLDELTAIAEADAKQVGRSRAYTLVAVREDDERYICPLKLRITIEGQGLGELVATLGKTVTDLIESNRKERNDTSKQMNAFNETIMRQYQRIVDDNERMRDQSQQVFKMLEDLKTKTLERTIMQEKHDKDIEFRERALDTVLPIGMAIANKWTKGALPAPDIQAKTIVTIAESMQENQLASFEASLTPENWQAFQALLSKALEKHANVSEFKAWVKGLTQAEVMGVWHALNPGQQAAMQELINGAN